MTVLTNNELLEQADQLNTQVYSGLTSSLGDIETKINALSINNQLSDLPTDLQTDLSGLHGKIGTAKESIGAIQTSNLGFLNNFKDFAVQNQINQEITNLYAQNQEDSLNTIQKSVEQDNINKMRMVEINRYYTQKNEAINGIIQEVLLGMVVILIIIILAKKEILPTYIAHFIGWGIVIYLAIKIAYKMYDFSRRNNLNFDEYDIPFDATAQQKMADGQLTDITQELGTELMGLVSGNNLFGCVGKDCCATGTVYNHDIKQCVDDCSSDCKYANYSSDVGGSGAGCYRIIDSTTNVTDPTQPC